MGTQPTFEYGFPVDPNNGDAVKRHVSMYVSVKIRTAGSRKNSDEGNRMEGGTL